MKAHLGHLICKIIVVHYFNNWSHNKTLILVEHSKKTEWAACRYIFFFFLYCLSPNILSGLCTYAISCWKESEECWSFRKIQHNTAHLSNKVNSTRDFYLQDSSSWMSVKGDRTPLLAWNLKEIFFKCKNLLKTLSEIFLFRFLSISLTQMLAH